MVKIVVACGGGIVTTTIVTDKIKELMKKNKIDAMVTPKRIVEIPGITDEDLIVVTGRTSAQNKAGIPIMIGMPLFTGMGEAKFIEELLAKINEIQGRKSTCK